MSPLAKSAFASAQRRLDQALAYMEDASKSGIPALFGLAYSEVLLAKGEFAAAVQLVELEAVLSKGDTDRPTGAPPVLRLVRT